MDAPVGQQRLPIMAVGRVSLVVVVGILLGRGVLQLNRDAPRPIEVGNRRWQFKQCLDDPPNVFDASLVLIGKLSETTASLRMAVEFHTGLACTRAVVPPGTSSPGITACTGASNGGSGIATSGCAGGQLPTFGGSSSGDP